MVERFHRQLKAAIKAARDTEPMNKYASGRFAQHMIGRQGNIRQISRRDGIRNDIASTR